MQDDYSDLENFINAINLNWSNIQNVANMTLLSKYFAASNFQGNWDDYVFLPHNFFLYSDPNFGFVLLPWDIEQNFNMGFNSLYGSDESFAPDFRIAPLLSGYKGYFDSISWTFGLDPNPRPLWDNLITDLDFVDPYLKSHKQIASNTSSLKNRVEIWFGLIDTTVLAPFHFTDPYLNPVQLDWWYFEQTPSFYFNMDKTRVLTFLDGRTEFVLSQLP